MQADIQTTDKQGAGRQHAGGHTDNWQAGSEQSDTHQIGRQVGRQNRQTDWQAPDRQGAGSNNKADRQHAQDRQVAGRQQKQGRQPDRQQAGRQTDLWTDRRTNRKRNTPIGIRQTGSRRAYSRHKRRRRKRQTGSMRIYSRQIDRHYTDRQQTEVGRQTGRQLITRQD